MSLATRPSVDSQGRFVGPHDIERGARHFWNVAHRRNQAPIVRDVPEFGRSGGTVNSSGRGGRGVPRPSRVGLTPDCFRRMHAAHQQGRTKLEIAAEFGISVGAVYYHLRPSVAMRCALAAAHSKSAGL